MAKLKAREKGTQRKMKVPLRIELRRRKGGEGSNAQGVLSLETKRTTLRNTACLIYSLFSHDVTRYPYLGVRHYGAPRQRNLMQILSHFYSSSHESRNTFRFDHGYFTGKLQ